MYESVLVVGGAARATATAPAHESVFPPALLSHVRSVVGATNGTVHALQLGDPPRTASEPPHRPTPRTHTPALSNHAVSDESRFDYRSVLDRLTRRGQPLVGSRWRGSASSSVEGTTGTTVFGPDGPEQTTSERDRQPVVFDYEWRRTERVLVEALGATAGRLVVSYRHKIGGRYAPAVIQYVDANDIDLILFGEATTSRRQTLRTSMLVEDLVLDTRVPVLSVTTTGRRPTPTPARIGAPTVESAPDSDLSGSVARPDSEPTPTPPASPTADSGENSPLATVISVVAPAVAPYQKPALRELFYGRAVSVGTRVHHRGLTATVTATRPATATSFAADTVTVGDRTRIRIDTEPWSDGDADVADH